jgi:predicted AAA+ superfamily ATPase
VAHPRVYVFDLGVRNALLRRPSDRVLEDERGLLLEHFVAYELHRRQGTIWPELELSFFRTRHGAEVDFVLRFDRDTWAVECKASRNVTPGALGGLKSIAEHVRRVTRRVVVCLAPRKQVIEGIEVLPLRAFLKELPR